MSLRPLLKFALATSFVAVAFGQEFLPLQVGNEWMYRASGSRSGNALTIRVTGSQQMDGQTWYSVQGYRDGTFWLRSDGAGKLIQYDMQSRTEKMWHDFRAAVRQNYDSAIPGAQGQAAVLQRNARYAGPIGEGNDAIEVYYPGVTQVGISNEKFLPGVGMVQRTQPTGGPAVAFYDLIYARVGGITVLKERTVDFSVTADRAVYPPNAFAQIRMTLRNDTGLPLQLLFRDGQRFDIIVKDFEGREVSRWSTGRQFIQSLGIEQVESERQWVGSHTMPAEPGDYVLEGLLTVTEGVYRATVPVRVER
jgi:hypothetical protein